MAVVSVFLRDLKMEPQKLKGCGYQPSKLKGERNKEEDQEGLACNHISLKLVTVTEFG